MALLKKIKILIFYGYILIFTLLISHNKLFAKNVDFEIIAGINPPLFIKFDGIKSQGIGVEILIAALLKNNIKFKISETDLPWTRAVNLATQKNSLTFLLRSIGREKSFKWISSLYDENSIIVNLKKNPQITSFTQINSLKKIGALAGSSADIILKRLELNDKYYPCKSDMQCLELLSQEKIDAWISTTKKLIYNVKKKNYNNIMNKYFILEKCQIWVATSLQTQEEDLQELKIALDKYKQTSQYKVILRKYD
ncbi:substrate-binding periplasmic protein [Fluviispira multicolorata]|uniref:Transporter substrate-binding domain-containing protein n=1 Tax=Fluviispira multicolorata TaxID=2654512 RepID=A0A833JEX7_9BACT|nr:transporter substrate-binding domain-containing protein [Fluviispira multicolorata]KAB8033441.1 transporter substrate-binding domain-containing protein [Fluviispira multicolorata]